MVYDSWWFKAFIFWEFSIAGYRFGHSKSIVIQLMIDDCCSWAIFLYHLTSNRFNHNLLRHWSAKLIKSIWCFSYRVSCLPTNWSTVGLIISQGLPPLAAGDRLKRRDRGSEWQPPVWALSCQFARQQLGQLGLLSYSRRSARQDFCQVQIRFWPSRLRSLRLCPVCPGLLLCVVPCCSSTSLLEVLDVTPSKSRFPSWKSFYWCQDAPYSDRLCNCTTDIDFLARNPR